jgi:hypothetical protein
VIRHLHTLGVDPHTIRPPITGVPPPAFSLPGPDKPYASEPSASQQSESQKTELSTTPASEAGLSLYAARLELKALQSMQKALHDMMEDNTESVEASPAEDHIHTEDASNIPEPMETSPVVATTAMLPTLPVEPESEPSAGQPPVAQPASTPSSARLNGNGSMNGATGTIGGLGGLVGYADSDGSDVEMDT